MFYNKPIYLGMCILDLSKTLTFDFHYNCIKNKYDEGEAKLLFIDMDSLEYDIKADDFYTDIAHDKHESFDFSEYLKDDPSRIKTDVNKKLVGMFKYEAAGKQI